MGKCFECSGTGVAERIGGYDRPCDVCRGDGRLAAWTPPMTNPNHTDTSRSGEGIDWGKPDEITAEVNLSHPVYIQRPQEAADRLEALEAQIDRLASFIMHCIEGEPSQSQGAVDTAIRIMTEQATTIGKQLAKIERLREALKVTHNLAVTYAVGSGTLFYEAMAEARAALEKKQ